uniref:uncharacterized protein LOC131132334 n=1 Tax=Doryrhamphus excisus TaxID=161450 RepID=UPI0025AE0C64|nr:uncharacterized protein LOC131132334 [Doryrhamphus excisus]
MFLRAAVLLWIASGYLPEETELCEAHGSRRPSSSSSSSSSPRELVVGNVLYEIWEESKFWSQARSSCGQRGGDLLKELNEAIKMCLKDVAGTGSVRDVTWWLGDGVRGDRLEPGSEDGGAFKDTTSCTYVKQNPFQLVTSSDCNHKRGFICTHSLRSSLNTQNTLVSRSRKLAWN